MRIVAPTALPLSYNAAKLITQCVGALIYLLLHLHINSPDYLTM